jgi:hypothetical protein
MKKTILIATLVLLGALGFTINAQAASCSDVIWNAEVLEATPAVATSCLEVLDKRGTQAVKLRARVVRQGVNSTIVQWQHPDGSWSPSERRYPERGATAEIDNQVVRITDLAPRQEVSVYIPMANNWSLPAPVVAAAPPPPPPPPAPEPEPEPEALPTTATQVSLFALLGGLFILLGGAISFARMRL